VFGIYFDRIPSADQIGWDRQELILTWHLYGAIYKCMSEEITYPKDMVQRLFEM